MGNLMALIGPIYAGALTKSAAHGWRWMFWINGIAYGISFLLILFMYQEKSRVKALGLTTQEVAKRFDYLGLILLTGGTVSFLCGLSWGGDKRYGWSTAHAIAPTVVGLVAIVIVLPLYELYGAKYPLVDRCLFRSRNFIVLNVQTFVIGFVQFSTYVCKCIYHS
jgi:MFS family permease